MLNLCKEKKFLEAIDTVQANIYWKDLNGRYLVCNKCMLDMLGLSKREDVIGKTDLDLFDLGEARAFQINDQIVTEKGSYAGEEYLTFTNGKKVMYWSSKSQLFDSQGKLAGITGISFRVVEHKAHTEREKQLALLEEKSQLFQIIDAVEASIFWKDKEGHYLGCNRYVVEMFGMQHREEIIGKTDFDFLPREDASRTLEIDQSVIKEASYCGEEYGEVQGKKRVYFTVKNQLYDRQGNVMGLIGTGLDITEKKEAERLKHENEIQNEKSKIAQIIDIVNASIYWKDLNGAILGCNQYVLDMFGVSDRREIIGKNEYDLVSEEEAIKITENDQFVLANGRYEGEEIFTVPTGGHIIHYVVKNRLLDSNNNVIGLVGTSLDITAQKEAELLKLEMEREHQQNAMLQLEKKAQQFLEEKQAKFNKMVDETAHDLRNPLTAINTALSSCHELPEEKLTRLRQSLNNAFSILYNLDDHRSKRSTSASTGVESRQNLLIADYVDEIVDEKKYQYINHAIDFELYITEAAKTAHIDSQPSQLRRALSNIVNNAIDALPKDRNGVIRIGVDADEKWVEIAIRDNGIGMSPEAIKKIQQGISFTENKLHGHGHGLQQVGEMLEYNQGKMKVDSIVGKGTEFQLFFPRSTPANWLAKEIVLQPDTIFLLLEDDTSLHHSWQYMLQRFISRFPTFQMKCFVEGSEVLRFVQTLTDEERIRVLFLADYELTYQTKNGLQIIVDSQINNAILMTGHSSNAEVRKVALDLGINLLPKQFVDKVTIRLANDPYKAN